MSSNIIAFIEIQEEIINLLEHKISLMEALEKVHEDDIPTMETLMDELYDVEVELKELKETIGI